MKNNSGLIGHAGFAGLRGYGLYWLASAVVLANDKKYWAENIRGALRESPKKYRRAVASQLCRAIAMEKLNRRATV